MMATMHRSIENSTPINRLFVTRETFQYICEISFRGKVLIQTCQRTLETVMQEVKTINLHHAYCKVYFDVIFWLWRSWII